eukprot:XP_019929445.1 PREDICTED: uncharacterized protein PB18E9.04c-like [Crassostrea gigas]
MESNPDIDKDVEHIPVKSPSRRKIWLPFLVIATLIVAAAVITTAVLLASKDDDSKNFTKKTEPSVTESFETTAMRTTHHLQQIDFTTKNATSSRITTSVTATNSTRISTSSSVTQLQAVSLDPITSSLATVLQTSLQKTYANSNATPVSLIQTYASNVSPVKLTRAKTSRYPKTTHYNLTSANPVTSRAPPQSVQTTIFTGRTGTQVPFISVHQPTPINSASIKPTFTNTIIPSTTSVFLIFKTKSTTSRTSFTNNITPKSSKTPVHIIAGNSHTKTPTPPTNAHRSTSSSSVSLPKSTQFSAILTTYTKQSISPATSTSRIPLTPLFTSVVARKTPF